MNVKVNHDKEENTPVLKAEDYKSLLEGLNNEMSKQVDFLQAVSHILDNNQMQALYEGVIGLYNDIYENLSINPNLLSLIQEKNNILQALINDKEKLKNNVTKIATRRIEDYYYTTNTRVEYLWFYSDNNGQIGEFILQDETEELMSVSKRKNSDDSFLCKIGLTIRNPDDYDFIIKNRVLCGSVLSALHGVVYDECKKLYTSTKDFKFSLIGKKPVITLDSIYRAFTRNNDARFSDVKNDSKTLILKALEVFRHCDVVLQMDNNKNFPLIKSTLYLFPANITEASNYNKTIQAVFELFEIPPILLIALHNDKYIKKVLMHSPSKAKKDGKAIYPSFKNLTDYSLYNPIHNFVITEKNKRISYSVVKYSTLFSRYLPDKTEEVLSRKVKRITNILDTLKAEKIIFDYKSDPPSDRLEIFYHSKDEIKKIEEKKEKQNTIKEQAKAKRLGQKEADFEFKKTHK